MAGVTGPFLPAAILAFSVLQVSEPACQKGAEALARERWSEAETLLQDCIARQPDFLNAYLQLCGLYQRQSRGRELAETALQGLERFPQEKRFYLAAGIQAGREAQYQEAIRILSSAFKRWPEDESVRSNLEQAYVAQGLEHLDGGHNSEAKQYLRQAMELDPNDKEALLNLGRALHNLNHSLEALSVFDRAAAVDPGLPLIHFHRGQVLYALGRYREAIEALDREIAAHADHGPSYSYRGQARLYRGEWEKAAADLEKAAAHIPRDKDALFALGRVLVHLGKSTEALDAFRRCVEIDPFAPGPYYSMGQILLRNGESDEAERLFEKAARLNEANRRAGPNEIRYGSPESAHPR